MITELQPNKAGGKQPAFGNLKVLVAEDNEVNRLLANSILQHWGLESKTAKTGLEVVNLLQSEEFDLVLMDIQMPEKNGIEATTEIRKFADIKKKNIPIIALTANALMGEEQKYIAAGMDDFLTKPFKENELYEVIKRVFDNEGSFKRDLGRKVKEESSTDEKLYDLKLVSEMAHNNPDFIQTLIKLFLQTVPPDSKAMVQACNEKNWMQVSKLAHKLKSTIDTLNLNSIKETVRIIELDGKNAVNIHAIPVLVEQVDSMINKVSSQLRKDFSL